MRGIGIKYSSTLFSLTIVFSIFSVNSVYADHATAGFGSGTAGPITTISAGAIPKGNWSIGFRLEYVDFDPFSDAQLISFALSGEPIHSTDNLLNPFLVVGYGLSNSFTLSARLPFVRREAIREGVEETPGIFTAGNDGDPNGIGDVSLFGQYQITANSASRLKYAVIGGIKIPVGKTDWTSAEGEVLDTEHQPGSGSWDFSGGIAATLKQSSRLTVDVSGLYTLVNEGENDVDLGDLVNYGLSFAYRLTGEVEHHHEDGSSHMHEGSPISIDVIVEGNGEWRDKESDAGIDDENSGGSLVYFAPGIRIGGHSGWSGFVSVGIPIVQKLNGIQHESDLRLLTGVSFTL